jgi:hypothetical protein
MKKTEKGGAFTNRLRRRSNGHFDTNAQPDASTAYTSTTSNYLVE